MKKWIVEWIPSILIALVLSLILQTYIAQAVTIPSASMVPTLSISDKLIINKMVKPDNLKFGDIVVFFSPIEDSQEERLIKRVIGLEGDVIEVKEGHLFRNGQKVEEPYLAQPINYEFGPITVPEDNFLFLGDNRNISYDSHLWPSPFIPKEKIIGKAIFRYYPFNRIGKI
ncbi:signal peptidase I [Irregularibacter muris]|uniref:Signal peptidase I n=1 Tax=Irregularibacter muris TaxID=1796619 RepID=A0AAE3HDR5_9FIRM|nr:signal peptidase I [Irregularibacter muris]MCR1897575.1 signal peptidase I [Irregularibacter muris]